tara:strand:+ start:21656 stop:22090 length:435 start_codon:yes stop_codon:yes gene_type:complete
MNAENDHRNWFQKNWKWAIPSLGCLSVIVVFILLFGAMVGKVTDMFKDSVPYSVGMENLQKNEFVINKLGEPIETDGMFQGNINYEDDFGTADLKIPVKGPKGEGSLMIIAEKNGEKWTYQTMEVSFKDSNEKINLLESFKKIE